MKHLIDIFKLNPNLTGVYLDDNGKHYIHKHHAELRKAAFFTKEEILTAYANSEKKETKILDVKGLPADKSWVDGLKKSKNEKRSPEPKKEA